MSFKKSVAFTLAIVFTLIFCCACNNENGDDKNDYFVEYNINAEQLYIDGKKISNKDYSALIKEAGELIRSIESEVSVEFLNSDISRINSADKDESVKVCERTYRMLTLSKELFTLTKGNFSPALFNLSALWGFTPEFEGEYNKSRGEPSEKDISAALIDCDFSDLLLLEDNTVQKTNSRLKLDLGGIAKGYMSDCLRELIEQKFSGKKVEGSLSVMSNSILLGEFHENEKNTRAWRVSIDNPRALTTSYLQCLLMPSVKNSAVTTSSDMYRFYTYDDKIYSHIINPSTGKPADNGIISITVVVPLTVKNSGTLADALSTAGFCMKLTDSLEFYNEMYERFGISAVVICSDFNYYTIGEITVQNLSDVNKDYIDVFKLSSIDLATDQVKVCDYEREYILKASKLYG